jgi:hypothetical protein
LSFDFRTKFKIAKEKDGVFSFWGHSCEIQNEDMWQDFEALIERMSSEANIEWSFINDLFVKDFS